MLRVSGSAVELVAVPFSVNKPFAGAVPFTVQMRELPDGKGFGVGFGKHDCPVMAEPGSAFATQEKSTAALGPAFIQVSVAVKGCPAVTGPGTLITALTSACGVTVVTAGAALFALFVSVVVLPALAVKSRRVTLAGALKELVQVIDAPTGNALGTGFGVQDCGAPEGRPANVHVGCCAALGPALVQIPVTVIGWLARVVAGAVMLACISAT